MFGVGAPSEFGVNWGKPSGERARPSQRGAGFRLGLRGEFCIFNPRKSGRSAFRFFTLVLSGTSPHGSRVYQGTGYPGLPGRVHPEPWHLFYVGAPSELGVEAGELSVERASPSQQGAGFRLGLRG